MHELRVLESSLLHPAHFSGQADHGSALIHGRGDGGVASIDGGHVAVAVVPSGTALANVAGGYLKLQADDALVYPIGERAVLRGLEAASRWILLALSPAMLLRGMPAFGRSGVAPLLVPGRIHEAGGLAQVAMSVVSQCGRPGAVAPTLLLDTVAHELAVLDRRFDVQVARCRGRTLRARRTAFSRLQRLRLAIQANPAKPYTLESLASRLSYTKFHFAHLFQHVYGLAPMEYVRRVRTAKAQELLLTTELAIAEVGRAAGFESHANLCRVFKQRTGLTPKQFRQDRPTAAMP